MAAHILTVNEITFKAHLNYMFIGIGKDGAEHQFAALADILSIKEGDHIIFYVMHKGFFGIFEADGNVFYEYKANEVQYLDNELQGKTLTYRMKIKPFSVYKKHISEWDMMENPSNIQDEKIFNMQWSWIFKKLNASRGCLSIDHHEYNLFMDIFTVDNLTVEDGSNYDYSDGQILLLNNNLEYDNNRTTQVPRDENRFLTIKKEEDLRILFTAKVHYNQVLNKVLQSEINGDIDFISNEVLCSFSERKMDLLFGTNQEKCLLIELKNKFTFNDNIYNQIKEYARWTSSYKLQYGEIIPILILKEAKILSIRQGAKYFKYLSQDNKANDIKSEWYKGILQKLAEAKIILAREDIKKLKPIQVYIFITDNDKKLIEFQQII